jgi:hypothetical protein
MIFFVPLLLPIALIEGFFVFAYNFEILKGYFHNNMWFCISWGALPVLAGYLMQTNSIGLSSIIVSIITALISLAHIKISRSYKELKRKKRGDHIAKLLEKRLKLISVGTNVVALIFIIYRLIVP